MSTKKERGRPLTYTRLVADAICARLAEGESLRAICADAGMPPASTVRGWVVDDVQGFAAHYARARDIGLDTIAEEIIEIADTTETGTKTVSKATGLETTEGDMIEHRRLKVEARKWYLSKLAPKRYGEKLELAGALTVKKSAADMTDEELTAIAAGANAKR